MIIDAFWYNQTCYQSKLTLKTQSFLKCNIYCTIHCVIIFSVYVQVYTNLTIEKPFTSCVILYHPHIMHMDISHKYPVYVLS